MFYKNITDDTVKIWWLAKKKFNYDHKLHWASKKLITSSERRSLKSTAPKYKEYLDTDKL